MCLFIYFTPIKSFIKIIFEFVPENALLVFISLNLHKPNHPKAQIYSLNLWVNLGLSMYDRSAFIKPFPIAIHNINQATLKQAATPRVVRPIVYGFENYYQQKSPKVFLTP